MIEPISRLILASASPRRSQLLDQIGVAHRILPVDADETPHANETPEEYVVRVAVEKARHGWERSGGELPVLAADTAVVLEGAILGKPYDEADALDMLRRLSGCEHRVLSAVALCSLFSLPTRKSVAACGQESCSPPLKKGGRGDFPSKPLWPSLEIPPTPPLEKGGTGAGFREPVHTATALSINHVCFRELTDSEIRAYWRSGEPCDKAGSYAVQGLGAVFVERLEGSYSGVMGLPLFETAQLLQQAGIYLLPDSGS